MEIPEFFFFKNRQKRATEKIFPDNPKEDFDDQNKKKKSLKLFAFKIFLLVCVVFLFGGGLLALKIIDKDFFLAVASIGDAIAVGGLRSAIKKAIK